MKKDPKKLNQNSWKPLLLMIFGFLFAVLPFTGISQKSVKAGKKAVVVVSEEYDEVAELEGAGKKRKRRKQMAEEEFVEEEYRITCGGDETSEEPPLPPQMTVSELSNYDMVAVAGGSFMMGCDAGKDPGCDPEESPAHTQTLGDYYIGRYEVTGRVWRSVMEKTPQSSATSPCDECPVVMVTREEIATFITRLNKMTGKQFRLPTEAEWEFAALGGNQSMGYRYSGSNVLSESAWHGGNCDMNPQTVGTRKPNELGIHDMSGNVWEWCADEYRKYGLPPTTPQTGATAKYVLRGGSAEDGDEVTKVKFRYGQTPDFISYNAGFRLAASK